MPVLRYLGFAEESSFLEDPAPSSVYHVDIASSSLDVPGATQIFYSGGLGRGARKHKSGFYTPSGDIVYAFDVVTIGYFLKWALGKYVFTEGTPNTHEIYGTNDAILDSFCARLGKDLLEHVFSGCVVNSLEIAIEDEFAQATIGVQAGKDAKDTVKTVSDLTLPSGYPFAFHEVTASLASSDVSAKVKSLTLTIENNVSAEAGRGLGSRFPNKIRAGERAITFSMDLAFENLDILEAFWGGASGPTESGASTVATEITFTGEGSNQMVLSLPSTLYTQVQQQPSGVDEIVQTLSAKSFIDTVTLDDGETEVETDILATLNNDEGDMTPA